MACSSLMTLLMSASLAALPGFGDAEGDAFEEADELFVQQKVEEAATAFGAFVKEYPKSEYTPEAQYKLACLLTCQGKLDEAADAHKKLIEQFPRSVWADLSLNCHLSASLLIEMADNAYEKAREESVPKMFERPARLYGIVAKRAPDALPARYRQGICLMMAGKADAGTTALKELARDKPGEPYAELAEIRSMPVEQTPRAIDRLERVEKVPGQAKDFLAKDMCRMFVKQFPTVPEAPACRRRLADALRKLHMPAEAVEEYRKLMKGGNKNADVMFWLAECTWRSEGADTAAEHYGDFLEDFEDDPRAETVRRWRKWLPQQDEASETVKKALQRLFGQIREGEFESLQLTANAESAGAGRLMRAEARFAGDGRSLISIQTLSGALIWAQNPGGRWVQTSSSRAALHSSRTDYYARPTIAISRREGSETMTFSASIAMSKRDKPGRIFQVAEGAVAYIHKRLMERGVHLRATDIADGTRLRMETLISGATKPIEVLVDLDSDYLPTAACVAVGEGGERTTVRATEIAVNKAVTDEDFAFPNADKAPVKEVKELNPLVVLSGVARLLRDVLPSFEDIGGAMESFKDVKEAIR